MGGDETPGAGVAALRRRLTVGTWMGALHGLAGACAVAIGVFGLTGAAVFDGHGFSLVIALVAGIPCVCFGAWMGRWTAQAQLLAGERAVREKFLLARWEPVPLRSIAEVGDGPVRLRGYARSVAPALSAQGLPCVATESLGDEVGAGAMTAGGVFELVDRHGDAVWVDARHVAVVHGLEFDGERNIPPGAMVELYGHATQSSDTVDEAVAGYRASSARWVVTGRRHDPVVLRMIG